MTPPRVLSVAVPAPRRALFDYLAPEHGAVSPGTRVRVPFGRRETVGVVMGTAETASVAPERLRAVRSVLDDAPLFSPEVLRLLSWGSDYYCHPIGDVVCGALPRPLRQGGGLPRGARRWVLDASAALPAEPPGGSALARRLWETLRTGAEIAHETVSPAGRLWLARWREAGWVQAREAPLLSVEAVPPGPEFTLNQSQQQAAQAIEDLLEAPAPVLLHGVTGSGKTEVYLRVIRTVLLRGRQALVLLPEIGLTPEFVHRLRYLGVPVALMHSGLADGERTRAFAAATRGEAAIVVGTRSAVFTPLARPGIIVVDEEHDLSYKQQEGFRYHGRDLAVLRAQYERVPIVLGSATPSLESLHNAARGRYRLVSLPERARGRPMPAIRTLDLRALPLADGISPPLLERLHATRAAGDQALLFLNRRGFAPVLTCPGCGWIASCTRCDAYFTWHRAAARLRCHHCQRDEPIATECPSCGGGSLKALGAGTERIEEALVRQFPGAVIERIDRDTTRARGTLGERLRRASEAADFLVGTQMLSKGHNFPRVTLVAVLAIDGALQSSDFRGPEHAAQLLVQVAGRAGRGSRPGEVVVQTLRPDDPLFCALRTHDYVGFGNSALNERRTAGYPPFTHLALLQARSKQTGLALSFLAAAREEAQMQEPGVEVFDPVPNLMARRAGWHRAQMLVRAGSRAAMHRFLRAWVPRLETLDRRVRWHIDVDPQVIES
ncbi:MAG: primosomal protein N' [Acidiferrobacteraceae bacterium]